MDIILTITLVILVFDKKNKPPGTTKNIPGGRGEKKYVSNRPSTTPIKT